MRLSDEVGLVLAVQSGLLDPMPMEAVQGIRQGLSDALDVGAAEIVRSIEESSTQIKRELSALLPMIKFGAGALSGDALRFRKA